MDFVTHLMLFSAQARVSALIFLATDGGMALKISVCYASGHNFYFFLHCQDNHIYLYYNSMPEHLLNKTDQKPKI